MSPGMHLSEWTGAAIKEQCDADYKTYKAGRTEQYKAWFAAHPELKDPKHEYKARDLASALPADTGWLDAQLPRNERHLHHLSGNSSQVLALGLLGVGARMDPSLQWLFGALGPVKSPAGHNPGLRFEKTLDETTLGEKGRQTSIDAFVNDPDVLLCLEAKWTEESMGKCSCGRTTAKGDPDDPDSVDEDAGGKPPAKVKAAPAAATGNCSEKVRGRKKYWDTLANMAMPTREDGKPCPLSFTYQCVRNVAAAKALAEPGQQAVFALIYDAENPYFTKTGDWHGWPAHMTATIDPMATSVRFAAVSWQQLTRGMPLDDDTVMWAREKHGLDEAG